MLARRLVLMPFAPPNLLTFSEQFDNAAWVKSNATVSANAAVAPDGTTTADKLIPSAAATDGRATQAITGGIIGGSYVFTVRAKAGEHSNCRAYVDDGGSNIVSVSYNLTTGAVATALAVVGGNWTGAATSIADEGGGWWLVTLRFTAAVAAPTRVQVWCRDAGSGTNGIYIWGAMLNKGTRAGRYRRVPL